MGGAPPSRGGRYARRDGDHGAAATVTTPVEREPKAIRARSSKEEMAGAGQHARPGISRYRGRSRDSCARGC
jgi:hypothetical protein